MKALALVVAAASGLLIAAALYWLTLSPLPPTDPCERQSDLSAAAMANEGLDQDTLVDRAMIERRRCKPAGSENPDPVEGADQENR